MPTYRVTTPAGLLDAATREAVAAAVARTHEAVTGARRVLVQVLFEELAADHCFVGGRPVARPHLFIDGRIRSGRPEASLEELLVALVAEVAEVAGLPEHAVWVYLSELPARRMVEFGRVLPEPGGEEAWLADLPPDVPDPERSGSGE